jgi:molybdopterin-guanine dinucleotide biosynthesis protein
MTEENNNELMNFLQMLQSGAEDNTPVEAFQSTPNNPNIELLKKLNGKEEPVDINKERLLKLNKIDHQYSSFSSHDRKFGSYPNEK